MNRQDLEPWPHIFFVFLYFFFKDIIWFLCITETGSVQKARFFHLVYSTYISLFCKKGENMEEILFWVSSSSSSCLFVDNQKLNKCWSCRRRPFLRLLLVLEVFVFSRDKRRATKRFASKSGMFVWSSMTPRQWWRNWFWGSIPFIDKWRGEKKKGKPYGLSIVGYASKKKIRHASFRGQHDNNNTDDIDGKDNDTPHCRWHPLDYLPPPLVFDRANTATKGGRSTTRHAFWL